VPLTSRLATHHDVDELTSLMRAAIDELQKGFLDDATIKASHAIMGLDTQLIDDGTYFVIESESESDGTGTGGERVVGCGGWSRRATLYGGNHSAGRDAKLLDPAADAARVRAMYTRPGFTRRGVGRLILELCEQAAADEGFTRLELMATLAGRPLYEAYGFEPVEEVVDTSSGTPIPIVRMAKPVTRPRRPANT